MFVSHLIVLKSIANHLINKSCETLFFIESKLMIGSVIVDDIATYVICYYTRQHLWEFLIVVWQPTKLTILREIEFNIFCFTHNYFSNSLRWEFPNSYCIHVVSHLMWNLLQNILCYHQLFNNVRFSYFLFFCHFISESVFVIWCNSFDTCLPTAILSKIVVIRTND